MVVSMKQPSVLATAPGPPSEHCPFYFLPQVANIGALAVSGLLLAGLGGLFVSAEQALGRSGRGRARDVRARRCCG